MFLSIQQPQIPSNVKIVQVCSWNQTMLLSSDGKLYVGGYGSNGRLSITTNINNHNNHNNINYPVPLSFFKSKFVKKIWCLDHYFALTSKNELYGWGLNDFSQLGLNSTCYISTPQLISIPNETILKVAAGSIYSLFLCKSQKVYGCGSNNHFQLSLPGKHKRNIPTEIPFLSDKNIIQVVAGHIHSLFLSNDFKIWGTGNNSYGQLGLSSTKHQEKCVLLKIQEKIIKIKSRRHMSFFLSISGNVYACGYNGNGSMGILNYNNKITVPTLIQSKFKFQDISCGWRHCLFLTTRGEVYASGINDKGQLGTNVEEKTNKLVKVKIKNLSSLKLSKYLNKMRSKKKLIDCIIKTLK